MRKIPLLVGSALAASLVVSQVAAQTPTSDVTCQSLYNNVQSEVTNANLDADTRAKIGEMLEGLSKQCQEGQYPDAESTAKSIREMIAKK